MEKKEAKEKQKEKKQIHKERKNGVNFSSRSPTHTRSTNEFRVKEYVTKKSLRESGSESKAQFPVLIFRSRFQIPLPRLTTLPIFLQSFHAVLSVHVSKMGRIREGSCDGNRNFEIIFVFCTGTTNHLR